MADRKSTLLRLDPAVYDALARWAGDELRSTNAQIEFLLRRALTDAGRMPRHATAIPRRGRPTKPPPDADNPDNANDAGHDSDDAGHDSDPAPGA